jgi:hypothetical protein
MKSITRLVTATVLIALPLPAFADAIMGTMYKNPSCTCCETYAAYLEKNGFKIDIKPTNDLDQVAAQEGVPQQLRGCHTIKFGKYIVEGFVPADQVKKMLTTMPAITGLSMPGMPMGIPDMGFDAMPGMAKQTYTTYAFTKSGGEPVIYDTYPKS